MSLSLFKLQSYKKTLLLQYWILFTTKAFSQQETPGTFAADE